MLFEIQLNSGHSWAETEAVNLAVQWAPNAPDSGLHYCSEVEDLQPIQDARPYPLVPHVVLWN